MLHERHTKWTREQRSGVVHTTNVVVVVIVATTTIDNPQLVFFIHTCFVQILVVVNSVFETTTWQQFQPWTWEETESYPYWLWIVVVKVVASSTFSPSFVLKLFKWCHAGMNDHPKDG